MDKLREVFKNISELEPSSKLELAILRHIRREHTKEMRQRLALAYFSLAGSTLAIIYTMFTFGQSILKSDFWNLLTLLFSDAQVVLANWSDFLFSILENFPVLAVIAVLVPIFLFTLSMFSYVNINNNRHKYI